MAPRIQRSASRLLGSVFSKLMSFVIVNSVYHEHGETERYFCGNLEWDSIMQKSKTGIQNPEFRIQKTSCTACCSRRHDDTLVVNLTPGFLLLDSGFWILDSLF